MRKEVVDTETGAILYVKDEDSIITETMIKSLESRIKILEARVTKLESLK